MNLEVGTSHQTEITEQWIGGPLVELLRLAALIERERSRQCGREAHCVALEFLAHGSL